MKNKKAAVVVFLFVVLFGAWIYHFFHSHNLPLQDRKTVEVVSVKSQNINQTARFIGTIKSEQVTTLVAKTKGILDRFVHAGQHVKKGELIAQIENKELMRNYKLSQEMEQIAKTQYERFNQLSKTGMASKNDLETKKASWIEAKKKMFDAKMVMNEINITAPFDGIVGLFKVHEGSQVQEGDVLVNVYDPRSVIVEFDVPLSVVKQVADGSPVFIKQQQYPLTHIQKMLDEETHMSPAYVSIHCDSCIIGATVYVDLVTKAKQAVLVIPYEAVFLREGKPFVYLVNKDKQTELRSIALGIREKKRVEIISGLKVGEQVVLRGQGRLYPGMAVQISAQKK